MHDVKWTRDLSIGVVGIDRQHKELISTVNRLRHMLNENELSGRDMVIKTVPFLCKYIEEHFKLEESLFTTTDYPHKTDHIEQHRAFLNETMEIVGMNRYDKACCEELLAFLLNWLVQHVSTMDRLCKPYFVKAHRRLSPLKRLAQWLGFLFIAGE